MIIIDAISEDETMSNIEEAVSHIHMTLQLLHSEFPYI